MVLFRLVVDEGSCINCGACMDLCPVTAIDFTRPNDTSLYGSFSGGATPKTFMMEKPFIVASERCTGCQICARECPTSAIQIVADESAPSNARPRPVIIRRERIKDDGLWHPLSEHTRDYLKRPIRSPWSEIASWRPTTYAPPPWQVWRSMRKPDAEVRNTTERLEEPSNSEAIPSRSRR